MAVVAGLRRARLHAGLSIRTLATRSGIAETNLSTIEHARRDPTAATIDKLTAALGVRLIPVPTGGRATAAETGDTIAGHLAEGDSRRAYRAAIQLADDLASAGPYLTALLAAEPARTGQPGWDGLIAAITEWRLQQAGLPAPAWVTAATGCPDTGWQPPDAILPARREHIAEPFARRGILLETDELAST